MWVSPLPRQAVANGWSDLPGPNILARVWSAGFRVSDVGFSIRGGVAIGTIAYGSLVTSDGNWRHEYVVVTVLKEAGRSGQHPPKHIAIEREREGERQRERV